VKLVPDFEKKTVKITQAGPNDSYLRGDVIGHGIEKEALDGDIIDVVAGSYKYKLNFKTCVEENVDISEKRKKFEIKAKPKIHGEWDESQKESILIYSAGASNKSYQPKVNSIDVLNSAHAICSLQIAFTIYWHTYT